MAKKIVDDNEVGRGYPIKPGDIDTTKHFWDAFGNSETEVSANFIVRLCQKTGGWHPFTQDEIEEFCGNIKFYFNKLSSSSPEDEHNFVILGEDNKYRVTHEFIAICFKSSPQSSMA